MITLTQEEEEALVRFVSRLPPKLASLGFRAIKALLSAPKGDFFAGHLAINYALGLQASDLVDLCKTLRNLLVSIEDRQRAAREPVPVNPRPLWIARATKAAGQPLTWMVVLVAVLAGILYCWASLKRPSTAEYVSSAKDSIFWFANEQENPEVRNALLRESKEQPSVKIICVVGIDQDNLSQLLSRKDSNPGNWSWVRSVEPLNHVPNLLILDYGLASERVLIADQGGAFHEMRKEDEAKIMDCLLNVLAASKS